MVIPTSLQDYRALSVSDRNKINKADLKKLIDSHLALIENDPNEISNVIHNTINAAIDKKFEQLHKEIRLDYDKLERENNTLRNAILEQQKFLDRVHTDINRHNIFITGVPCSLQMDSGEIVSDPTIITHAVLKVTSPDIIDSQYKIAKSFDPKEGQNTHSVKVTVLKDGVKPTIMKNKFKFKDLGQTHALRKVFIKNETSPITRKENDRIYTKMKKLKDENCDKEYKIVKGKLYDGENVIDEFNINNSLFR